MKKRGLRGLKPGTAAYVVAHAAYRAKRGGRRRNPSVPYLGILDAREALRVAQQVMEINDLLTASPSPCHSFWYGLEEISPELFGLEAGLGSEVVRAIAEAKGVAKRLDMAIPGDPAIQFDFNGVMVRVRPDSNVTLLYRDWRRGLNRYLGEDAIVGPHPKQELSEGELASDARIEAANEERRQERQRVAEAEARARREAVEARLEGAGPMEFSDEPEWNEWKANNADGGYGEGIFTYAERWARLMQVEMALGNSLEEIASQTSHDADLEGMSGFSHGAAVATLAHCWAHGERLRRWHNRKYQPDGDDASDTGGVINPAVLTISTG